jgi:hypothetical protein
LTGTIADYGTSVKTTAAGKPDAKGGYSEARLQSGTILLDRRPLQAAIAVGTDHAHVDLASCSLHGSATATMPIVSGTGAYAGISGSVRFTFAEIGTKFTSGSHKGQCNKAAARSANGPR